MFYLIGAAVCFLILLVISAVKYEWSIKDFNSDEVVSETMAALIISFLGWYLILPVLFCISIARLFKT